MIVKSTVPMALMDALPVLFFGIAMWMISRIFPSVIFNIGATLCVLAGAGKVLWKLILALGDKSIDLLYKQLRYLMPAGFILMFAALIVDRQHVNLSRILGLLTAFPVSLLILAGIAGMCLMGVCGKFLDPSKASSNWIEQGINLIAQLCFLTGVAFCWMDGSSYQLVTTDTLELYPETVQIKETAHGQFYDGPGEDTALIFYQGAMVEEEAYCELMAEYANAGIDCFLMEMPFNVAFMGINLADEIRNDSQYAYGKWYLGGHSLGGAMAASYMKDHHSQYDGLILLGAYSADKIEIPPEEEPFDVLVVYGTNDQVLSQDKMDYDLLPQNTKALVLKGGNHASFGTYGPQKGDGPLEMDAHEQKRMTVENCIEFMLK